MRTEPERKNLSVIRDYRAALQNGQAGQPLARFFTANAASVNSASREGAGVHVRVMRWLPKG